MLIFSINIHDLDEISSRQLMARKALMTINYPKDCDKKLLFPPMTNGKM